MTGTGMLERQISDDGKLVFIWAMRNDTEVMEEIRRGLEARRTGKLVSWEEVKARFEQPQ